MRTSPRCDLRQALSTCANVLMACIPSGIGMVAHPLIAENLHVIEIIDADSGRGVPLVEVTIADRRWVTDSGGVVALEDPAFLDREVSLEVRSYGYRDAAATVSTTVGAQTTISIERIQLAERLYRVTGVGIYRDSVKAGRPVSIEEPLSNANVRGQDSVQTAIYRGRIHWIWGDTLYQRGFGNFRAAGATSALPGQGGLPASAGVNLDYYLDALGSAREMMPLKEPGPVWLDGLFTARDAGGDERMLARFIRLKSFEPLVLYEQGLALFSDDSKTFRRFRSYELDTPITPAGHAFRYREAGRSYIGFAQSYPNVRVPDDWSQITDIRQWEAYSPLREDSRYDAANPPLDLGPQGRLVFGWKKNTDPLTPEMIRELVEHGHLRREDTPFRLRELGTNREIQLHRASVHWNDYRSSWIMIGTQLFGDSCLGEVWFAEAPLPTGPWVAAIKIVTHHDESGADYSFYNPTSHPFLDEESGRRIYFEGTYSRQFSGNATPTPHYDYNQIMYRLDLGSLPR